MTFQFRYHVIDTDLPTRSYAQTALADLDNDGQLEFIVGQQYGDIFWYKMHTPDRWSRHLLGADSPSDVGAWLGRRRRRLDRLRRRGRMVSQLARPRTPFTRFTFDPELTGVHDVVAADIDGDGRARSSPCRTRTTCAGTRFLPIPRSPGRGTTSARRFTRASRGRPERQRALDIVRTNVWFENVNGDATKWQVRPIGPTARPRPTSGPTSPSMPPSRWSAT